MERTTRSENGGNHHHLLWDLSFASACCLVVLENNLFPGFEVCICFREGNNLALWILNGFPLPFPGTLKNYFLGGLLAFFLAIFLILSHFGGILLFFWPFLWQFPVKNNNKIVPPLFQYGTKIYSKRSLLTGTSAVFGQGGRYLQGAEDPFSCAILVTLNMQATRHTYTWFARVVRNNARPPVLADTHREFCFLSQGRLSSPLPCSHCRVIGAC